MGPPDHDRVVGSLDVKPLEARAQIAQLNVLPIHPDVAVLANRDEQISGFVVLRRNGVGFEDLDARFLDERRRDDEEDQQIDAEIEHRREIDAVIFAFWRVSP